VGNPAASLWCESQGQFAGNSGQVGSFAGFFAALLLGLTGWEVGPRPMIDERKTLGMKWTRLIFPSMIMLASQALWLANGAREQSAPPTPSLIRGGNLTVEAFDDGFDALRSTAIPGDVLRSEVEADSSDGTLRSSLYPRHLRAITSFDNELGPGQLLTVTHTGLPGKPDLVREFRVYQNQPWGISGVS